MQRYGPNQLDQPEPTPAFATPARDEADVNLVRGEDDIDQALQDSKNNVPPQPGDLDII